MYPKCRVPARIVLVPVTDVAMKNLVVSLIVYFVHNSFVYVGG